MKQLFLALSLLIIHRHDIKEEKFLVNASDYPEVIQLKLQDATGIVVNEGTLISDRWILTAAHGLSSIKSGQTLNLNGQDYSIHDIIVHPEWDGADHDLALLELNRSVNGIEPAVLYKQNSETGKVVTLIGRGWTGTGQTGPTSNDEKLRKATNQIDEASNSYLRFRFDEPDHKNATDLEGISGPADSGGPAFIFINGVRYLAGVSSHQDFESLGLKEGQYGVIEYYTRVSTHVDWINDVLSGNYIAQPAKVSKESGDWGLPRTQIGDRAIRIMNALRDNNITKEMIEETFNKKFRKSTNLNEFLTLVSKIFVDPKIQKIIQAKPHLLSFEVMTEDKVYYVQIDAEKRNDFKVGGLTVKKIGD